MFCIYGILSPRGVANTEHLGSSFATTMYRQQMEATRCTTVETTKRGGQKKKSSISMIASPPHKNLAQSRLKNFLKAAPTISKQHQVEIDIFFFSPFPPLFLFFSPSFLFFSPYFPLHYLFLTVSVSRVLNLFFTRAALLRSQHCCCSAFTIVHSTDCCCC